MSAAPSPASAQRNSIGFLRLLLAALVIYTHAFWLGGFNLEGEWLWRLSRHTIQCGTFAVQCFFVLSGALIAASWNRLGSLPRFLWCRALRLIPAFWLCLAVTAFVLTPLLYFTTAGPLPPFFGLSPSAPGYVWHNLLQPTSQVAIGPFPNGGPNGGDWNGSLWTLFYEGACYLMFAGLGLLGCLRRIRWLGGTVLLGLLLPCTVWAAAPPGWLPPAVNRLFDTPGKVDTLFFFAGTLWAVFPEVAAAVFRPRWSGPAAGGLLFAGWCLGVHTPLALWLLPVVLFWLGDRLPLANLESRLGGDYSYGLYLFGFPVQQTLAHFHLHEFGFAGYFALSLLTAGLCAVLSWHLVERHALGWKSLGSGRPRPTTRDLQRSSPLAAGPEFRL